MVIILMATKNLRQLLPDDVTTHSPGGMGV
jgi:hypothetical protein